MKNPVQLLLLSCSLVGVAFSIPQAEPPAAKPSPPAPPVVKGNDNGGWIPGQSTRTPAGTIVGAPSQFRPLVSTYLGVRYGRAPVRDLRFQRPYRVAPSKTPINARQYGPDCPTITAMVNSTLPISPGASKLLGYMAQAGNKVSEDCLSLNIWTKPQVGERSKAVLVFVHGGGFSSGTGNNPLWDGAIFAEEQDIVVVNVNYRLGVFGFPGAPKPTAQNPGLMDIRLAVEWVRDNIASFGGDPDRIVLMGHDAGAVAADMYAYTYVYNTIVKGIILMSGEARDVAPANTSDAWFQVTQKLDCGGIESGVATMDCARVRSMDDILKYSEDGDEWSWLQTPFVPRVDNSLVFSDYSKRAAKSQFAKIPVLIGNTHNEGGIYRLLPFSNPEFLNGVPAGVWDGLNRIGWTCPAASTARLRIKANLPVWRYRFFGDFPNTVITPDAGSWHGSELLTLFGTVGNLTNIADTPIQQELGKYMRGAWASFIKDPFSGLTFYNWPIYNPQTLSLVRLGYKNTGSASAVKTQSTDAKCHMVKCAVKVDSGDPDLVGWNVLGPAVDKALSYFGEKFELGDLKAGPDAERIKNCMKAYDQTDKTSASIKNSADTSDPGFRAKLRIPKIGLSSIWQTFT